MFALIEPPIVVQLASLAGKQGSMSELTVLTTLSTAGAPWFEGFSTKV